MGEFADRLSVEVLEKLFHRRQDLHLGVGEEEEIRLPLAAVAVAVDDLVHTNGLLLVDQGSEIMLVAVGRRPGGGSGVARTPVMETAYSLMCLRSA